MIGRTLNHYRIVGRLGRGGMGEVYAAEDTKLGRQVALKILPDGMAADPERRARFEREARAVAAFNHPNIVTIHSVEEADGRHFITMELVEGKPLSAHIGKTGLPLKQILDHGEELAGAVGAAHQRGIIHRDLKPDNVMIGDDGRLRVLDFGLAKLKEVAAATPDEMSELPTKNPSTEEGRVLGTVAYMSPEQAEGKPVDARSDIFSLGVILYEAATGRRPFRGDTNVSTISSILRDTPASITELNPGLPRHLSRIVSRCLRKEPEKRYQTAIDLRNELEGLKEEVDSGQTEAGAVVRTEAPSLKGTRKRAAILAGGVLVLSAAVALWLLQGSGGEPEGAFESMKLTRLTNAGISQEAAISPDGKYFARVDHDESGWSLSVTQISTGSSVQLLEGVQEWIANPVYGPDGEMIYYTKARDDALLFKDLFLVPALGGEPRPVAEDVDSRPSFDGKRGEILFRRGESDTATSLIAMPARGGPQRVILRMERSGYMSPAGISPDGETIAVFISEGDGLSSARLELFSATGEPKGRLGAEPWRMPFSFAWIPDGSGLMLAAGRTDQETRHQIFEISYPGGSVRRVTNDLYTYSTLDLSRSGDRIVTVQRETTSTLWKVKSNGEGEPAPITRGARRQDGVGIDWSPDGRVLYGSVSSGQTNVWIADSDGDKARQLTHDGGSLLPAVCGNPSRIFFNSMGEAGKSGIWVINFDGSGLSQVAGGGQGSGPRCGRDGEWVYYQGPGGTVWRVPSEGGDPERIIDQPGYSYPVPSPDGTRIALWFADPEANAYRISLLDTTAGEGPVTIDLPLEVDIPGLVDWSPDGEELYYVATGEGVQNIWAMTVDGGEMRQVTRFDSGRIYSMAVSPDGKDLAVSRARITSDVVLIENFR